MNGLRNIRISYLLVPLALVLFLGQSCKKHKEQVIIDETFDEQGDWSLSASEELADDSASAVISNGQLHLYAATQGQVTQSAGASVSFDYSSYIESPEKVDNITFIIDAEWLHCYNSTSGFYDTYSGFAISFRGLVVQDKIDVGFKIITDVLTVKLENDGYGTYTATSASDGDMTGNFETFSNTTERFKIHFEVGYYEGPMSVGSPHKRELIINGVQVIVNRDN